MSRERTALLPGNDFLPYIPLVQDSSEAVCLISPTGVPVFINPSFQALSEYPSLSLLIDSGGLSTMLGQPSVAGMAGQKGEVSLLTRTGKERRVVMRAVLLTNSDQAAIGTAFFFQPNLLLPVKENSQEPTRRQQVTNSSLLDIFHALPAEIAFVGTQGMILSVNESWAAFARANQYAHSRYGVGENYLQICETAQGKDGEEARAIAKGIRDVIAGSQPSFSSKYLCHSSTNQRWLRLIVTPIQKHYPTPVVITHLDITDLVVVQQELEESKQYYQSLFENHPDAVFSLDLAGRVTSGNKAFARLAEAPMAELLHHDYLSFFAPEHQAKAKAFFSEVCQGYSRNYNMNVVTTKGTHLMTSCTKMPIVVNGKLKGVFNITRDVTAERKAQDQLAESTWRLHTILDSITDGFYAMDNYFTITYWNKEAEQILKVTRKEAVGCSLWSLFPDARGSQYEQEFNHALDENVPVHFEVFYPRLTLWTEVSAYPSQEGLSVYFRDVGERKRGEERLQKYMAQLEKINHELDQFVYRTSHDLRAPLVSILGLISITQAEANEEQKNEYLNLMARSVHRLDKFIQDIINYSKNARTELDVAEVDLGRMIQETIEELQYMEEAQPIVFRTELCEIRGFSTDANRLGVVLHNLVANAIRYHDLRKEKPYIALRVQRASQGGVTIQVEDNGQGIAEQHQTHIFEMFYRASSSKTGSGLGLYIVAENLKKLGGAIQVSSEAGKGTTFTLLLPNLAPSEVPGRNSP